MRLGSHWGAVTTVHCHGDACVSRNIATVPAFLIQTCSLSHCLRGISMSEFFRNCFTCPGERAATEASASAAFQIHVSQLFVTQWNCGLACRRVIPSYMHTLTPLVG